MAIPSIAAELAAIENAVYGEEVRTSIRDAIRKLYNAVDISDVSSIPDKLDKDQGVEKAGQALIVGADGNVTTGQAGASLTVSGTTLIVS